MMLLRKQNKERGLIAATYKTEYNGKILVSLIEKGRDDGAYHHKA